MFLTPDAFGYNGVPGVVDVLDAAADANATITATVFADSISESFGFSTMQIARTDNLGTATVTIASSDTDGGRSDGRDDDLAWRPGFDVRFVAGRR